MTTINKVYTKTVRTKSGEVKQYKSVISYDIKNATGVSRTHLKDMIRDIKAVLSEFNKYSPYSSEYATYVNKVKQILDIINE